MPQNVVRREAQHLYANEPVSPAAKDAVRALLRVQNDEEKEIDRVRSSSGLSENEFRAIRYLLQAQREERDTGPKDLVVMLGISNASVTNIIDRLERLGDLERVPHPSDRRAQLLRPTVAAAEKIGHGYHAFHQLVVDVMSALPEHDAITVARVLNEVSERIEKGHTP